MHNIYALVQKLDWSQDSNKTLRIEHNWGHRFWGMKRKNPDWGKKQGWTLSLIKKIHDAIVKEGQKRKLDWALEHKSPLPPKKSNLDQSLIEEAKKGGLPMGEDKTPMDWDKIKDKIEKMKKKACIEVSSKDKDFKRFFLGELDGFKVYICDYEKIHEKFKWEQDEWGGHGWDETSSYIPKDEIWIADNVPQENIYETISHEFVEVTLMSKGKTYLESHPIAQLSEKPLEAFVIDALLKDITVGVVGYLDDIKIRIVSAKNGAKRYGKYWNNHYSGQGVNSFTLYIPYDEIWVTDTCTKDKIEDKVTHRFLERIIEKGGNVHMVAHQLALLLQNRFQPMIVAKIRKVASNTDSNLVKSINQAKNAMLHALDENFKVNLERLIKKYEEESKVCQETFEKGNISDWVNLLKERTKTEQEIRKIFQIYHKLEENVFETIKEPNIDVKEKKRLELEACTSS